MIAISSLKFEKVEHFVNVCRFMSVSKAAKHLYISQQALSRSIKKLEDDFGYALFQRSPRGMIMTNAGKLLYERFSPIVNSFQNAVLQTEFKTENQVKQTLEFSVGQGAMRMMPPEVVLSFSELYPNVDLKTIKLHDKQNEQYILSDVRRFGLMVAPEWLHKETYNYIPLKTEPAYLIVHISNPLAKLSCVSLALLKDERVLALSRDTNYQKILDFATSQFGFSVTPYFEGYDILELFSMVNRGSGVLLTELKDYQEASLSNCTVVPVKERTADFCIAFVFQEYSALDPLAHEFIEFVQERYKGE